MEQAIEERLARLERRLGALEAARERTSTVRPKAPRRPPTPATSTTRTTPLIPPPLPRTPVTASPARPPTPEPTPSVDWERFFGLAVLGRVGVAAVLLAAGYFAQLAYKGMPDVGRVISIYGLAAAFFGVGAFVRERVARHFVALLWGGATSAAYLAAVVAHLKYDLVGDTAALALLVFASACGQAMARSLRHKTLASMALGGAFAAPLIADASLAHGSFVLVYLLALHTWSAWVERVWRWQSARVVGLVGTLAVASTWLLRHGTHDATTYVLIHLYMLGLMAPELLCIVRRERLSLQRQSGIALAVGLAAAVMVTQTLLSALSAASIPVPALGLLAGAGWTGLAVFLAGRARSAQRGRVLVRGLAYTGGLLLATGVIIATAGLPRDFPFEPETVGVWGTVFAALGALALRQRLGVGELAASVATALACIVAIVPRTPAHVFVLFPVAAAGAVALILFGKHIAARSAAAWSGLLAVGVGVAAGTRFAPHDTLWIAVAILGATAWASGLLALGRLRGLRWLEYQGAGQVCLVAAIWAGHAFGSLRGIQTPLLDPMSIAGLILAAVAGHAAWLRHTESETDDTFLLSLWLIALAVPLLVGHREVLAAVESLERVARAGWHTLYFASAAVVLAWLGRRDRAWLSAAALGVGGIALVSTVLGLELRGASPWAAAQLAATLGALVAVVQLGGKRQPAQTLTAFVLYGATAACWIAYHAAGRLPHDPALLNLRFLVGLLALAGAFVFPYQRLPDELRAKAITLAKYAGVTLGFLVGHAEIWALVGPLEGAWPKVLVSVYMVLYAAGLLTAGFLRRDAQLRYPALALFGVVVVKIGLIDLASAETALRIFVTGILGLVLLASAFAYARKTSAQPSDGTPVA